MQGCCTTARGVVGGGRDTAGDVEGRSDRRCVLQRLLLLLGSAIR